MMLLGALAALVPVIIHLINRAKARPIPFAALEFLFLSDKRLARRLKLRQLLVLALRVLLLAAIPFAFAKPYLTPDIAEATSLSQPGAVVVIVDDSASMGAVLDGADDTLMARAIDRAREVVAAGGDQTSFAVVTASLPARLLTSGLTFDRGEVEKALATLNARPSPGDMAGALREAERLLAEVANVGEQARRVVVIGDHAVPTWAEITQPWALDTVPETRVIDVRDGASISNLAITGVEVRVAPEVGDGAVEVAVQVKNLGASPAEAQLMVEVAGKTLAGKQSLPPGKTATKRFIDRFNLAQAAGSRGVAGLIGEDGLKLDDRWFFTLDAGGAAPVAVINGAPRTTAWLDELFFVRAALTPDEGALPKLRTTILSPDDITKAPLEAYEVVMLANVGKLSAAQRMTLENYVNKGGSILISAGDQLTPQAASTYGPLMPTTLRGIKTVVRRDDPSAPLKALNIGQVDGDHPAMTEFSATDDTSLFKTKVFAYALVDTTQRDTHVVMGFSGGVPALVEASMGRGRTMLLTTTVDRDWTDLPIRTSFVPFLQQTLLYLAGRLGDDAKRTAMVGDMVAVPPPQGEGKVTLTRPDGATRDLGDEAVEEYTVVSTDVVGHYTLTRPGAKDPVIFAINADRSESNLTPANLEQVGTLLAKAGTGTVPEAEDGANQADAVSNLPPNRTKVWPFILVLLFVLLASEAWLVLRS